MQILIRVPLTPTLPKTLLVIPNLLDDIPPSWKGTLMVKRVLRAGGSGMWTATRDAAWSTSVWVIREAFALEHISVIKLAYAVHWFSFFPN